MQSMPKEARNRAMACHRTAQTGLAGNGIGMLVGPPIVWLLKREHHPFIDGQGREAVNFQLTIPLAVRKSLDGRLSGGLEIGRRS